MAARVGGIFQPVRYFVNRLAGRRIEGAPLFVVGCEGSGISFLLRTLDRHPRLFAIREPTRLAFLSAEEQLLLLDECDRAAIAAGKVRWVEGTPAHVTQIGTLLALAPEARVVVVTRDPRDVVCVLRERGLSAADAAARWVECATEAAAWLGSPQLHHLRVEDLLDDFVSTMVGVTNLIDERYLPPMKQAVESRDGRRLAAERGRWRENLDPETRRVVINLAGARMREMGYDPHG